ncbi:MAG: class I SAM-dependent methyltransferase [Bacteroidota bacterium]|nr:class I SAM-dependent methyltransferase [Bacteroidota bacterium]
MNPITIQELIGNTDIYLLDQIIKRRYKPTDKILDAGCGGGKNLFWFLKNEIDIYGIDKDATPVNYLKSLHPDFTSERFQVAETDQLPFEDNFFDHVISSAVLHFAKSTPHFYNMVKELVRVLKPKGSLFIRMASSIGLEDKVKLIEDGVYHIPDGTARFLLTPTLLDKAMQQNNLSFIEPLKIVNVNNIRCMSTLVLMKN